MGNSSTAAEDVTRVLFNEMINASISETRVSEHMTPLKQVDVMAGKLIPGRDLSLATTELFVKLVMMPTRCQTTLTMRIIICLLTTRMREPRLAHINDPYRATPPPRCGHEDVNR
jgi:hypothetical protein